MGIFDILSLLGGLSLFLFGMSIMGQALEKKAGSKLRIIIENITKNKYYGLLTGIIVTAIIQSSSATTVMVVGFVNSGIMTLRESISIIMGANVGTTITSWILSLAGLNSNSVYLKLLKPSSFTPILAFVGVIFYVFLKNEKKKDTGLILLGFATLMFGMEHMTSAVSCLKNVKEFQMMFIMFQNPILGIIVGAVLTAIIQSSSASVGILQALASTGVVTYGSAIPIIMGQNIGTCATALISSVGASTNAKRASLFHLFFNLFGTIVFTIIYLLVKTFLSLTLLNTNVDMVGIAIIHTMFNLLCTILVLPLSNLLEKIVIYLVKDKNEVKDIILIDERLLKTPSVAIYECRKKVIEMCKKSIAEFQKSLDLINNYDEDTMKFVIDEEKVIDDYEDKIGSFLVSLSSKQLSIKETNEVGMYLKVITDFERISDHSLNVSELVCKLKSINKQFSKEGHINIDKVVSALYEITSNIVTVFETENLNLAYDIEPLEQVIDDLVEDAKEKHVERLQHAMCDFSTGFIYNDLLINMERVSDHCSNVAGLIIDSNNDNLNTHMNIENMRIDGHRFNNKYMEYKIKYGINIDKK